MNPIQVSEEAYLIQNSLIESVWSLTSGEIERETPRYDEKSGKYFSVFTEALAVALDPENEKTAFKKNKDYIDLEELFSQIKNNFYPKTSGANYGTLTMSNTINFMQRGVPTFVRSPKYMTFQVEKKFTKIEESKLKSSILLLSAISTFVFLFLLSNST